MLLSQELKELLHTEVAVIMNDGMAYRGTLEKFDKELLVLSDIYETSNQEIDWIESDAPQRTQEASIRGYVPWRRITLPRLIIRLSMVLRIWPWAPHSDTDTTTTSGEGSTAKPRSRTKRRAKAQSKKSGR